MMQKEMENKILNEHLKRNMPLCENIDEIDLKETSYKFTLNSSIVT